MIWYNQAQFHEFLRNSKEHFNSTKIINFDIIRRLASGENVPDNVLKKSQTVQDSRVSQYRRRTGIIFHLKHLRLKEKDIYFEKKGD